MRLGLTESTYQYLFAGPQSMFGNRTSGYFDMKGMPLPYFLSTPAHIDSSLALEWLIERTASLGLQVAHCSIRRWDEPGYPDKIKALLTRHKLELMPSIGVDLIATGDTTKRSIESAVLTLQRYKAFGGIKISKFCTSPMIHNRFRAKPPLEEQLARIIEGARPIVQAAEEAGITLAFENHLDYRISEIVRIVQAVGSPNLRILFDAGNTMTVIEDPIEAAIKAAPYTVLVHLKDVRVMPWTPGALYVAAVFACPLGRGNVDNVRNCEKMRDSAPDPASQCHSLENMPVPPNEDEDLWVIEGIKWARENLGAFLG